MRRRILLLVSQRVGSGVRCAMSNERGTMVKVYSGRAKKINWR